MPTAKASCIHELDVVRLLAPATGWGPRGEQVTVPAGAEGTVVLEHQGSDWLEVEIVDRETGVPRAFVEVQRADVKVTWRSADHRAA